MTERFSINDLIGATLVDSFSFTKGAPLLKLRPKMNNEGEPVEVQGMNFEDWQSALYDHENDPKQVEPIINSDIEEALCQQIIENMMRLDAPVEAYRRFGFEKPKETL